MSRASNNLLIFFTGLAVGAVAGILYAPDEGKNTRDRLSFRLDKYRENLRDILGRLRDAEKNLPISQAKTEGEKVIQDTKQEAEKLLSDVEALMKQISSLKTKKD
jgi:gas vesicle protein